MAYVEPNFPTKKALKEALSAGQEVSIFNPGLGGDLSTFTGTKSVEGPHYPKPHSWYASVQVVNGQVTKVTA